jgi:putative sigma-54 modulation protein
MQIELTGTNVEIDDALRELVSRRLDKIGRQVSELAVCEVILAQERNPSIKASQKAEAILVLKGATLNAKASAAEMSAALSEVAEDLQRQVVKLRDKRIGKQREGAPSIRHLETVAEAPEEAGPAA